MPDPAMDGAGEGMETNDHEALVRLAVLETRLNGTVENITLQAKEYERRLNELNHAHAQQSERNAEYVRRDVYDSKLNEWEQWRRQIDQWRWVSIGAAAAAGGLAGYIAKLLGG